MPVRFRRTFKVFPGVRVNVSRSGISTTVGPRGFHFTFNKRGISRTVGLPGTGLSESSYIVKNEPESEKEKDSQEGDREKGDQENGDVGCFPWGCLLFILIALVIAYFAANALGLLPPHYLSDLLEQFMQWVRKLGF